MRWWILFFLIFAVVLWLAGVIHVNLPPSLAFLEAYQHKSSGTSTSSLNWSWVSTPSPSTTYHVGSCSIDVPSGWTVKNSSDSDLLVLTNGRAFHVKTLSQYARVDVDAAYFSNQMLSQSFGNGFRLQSENRDPFQGHPAYSALLTKESGGATFCSRVTFFSYGELLYLLASSMQNGDPESDSQLSSLFNSVRIGN